MGEEKDKIKNTGKDKAAKDAAEIKAGKEKKEDKRDNNTDNGKAAGNSGKEKSANGKKNSTAKQDSAKAGAKKTDEKSKKVKDKEKIVDGLDDLPEEIQKKLEKMKAEREQKQKKTKKTRRKKKREQRSVSVGKAFIKSTYNNTIVTLTDLEGNVISWASAGIVGFKGPKKSTPYAAQIITRLAVAKARQEYNLRDVSVFVKGVGTGRESAIRALNSNGLLVTSIKDVTPMPHNGCRPKKPRRV